MSFSITACPAGDDDRRQGRASDRDGLVERRDVAADGRTRSSLRHALRRETSSVAAALEHVLSRSRRFRMHAGKK